MDITSEEQGRGGAEFLIHLQSTQGAKDKITVPKSQHLPTTEIVNMTAFVHIQGTNCGLAMVAIETQGSQP